MSLDPMPIVASGQRPSVAKVPLLQMFLTPDWLAENFDLPPRQSQIVQAILAGHSDKQIAAEMSIAVPTVRTHLSRLFQRFGLNDRVELILFVAGQFFSQCHTAACPRFQLHQD
jgi:DNA-binding NarL/FixJ family response regulator